MQSRSSIPCARTAGKNAVRTATHNPLSAFPYCCIGPIALVASRRSPAPPHSRGTTFPDKVRFHRLAGP